MAVTTPQPQQYCLRWNNHQHNLLSVFEDLLNHEAFVDVTIACDGLNLKAHKMVLSACSPYFQSMFYNTPDRHPILFLKDVRYHEMKALLEFMYRGEVSVDQENLSSLLKVAESLKIKGLAEVNESHGLAPRLPIPSMSLPSLQGYSSTGLLSPDGALKRYHSSTSPQGYLGPKRKRGRPRRLSGSEAVPLASGLAESDLEETMGRPRSQHDPLPLEVVDDDSPVKNLKEGSRAISLSPGDSKAPDFHSEGDSTDDRSSGLLTPKKESCWEETQHTLVADSSGRSPGSRGNLASQPGDPESMSEMSVRGLDLLKYASISQDGSYRCIECEKVQICKNFKNKYSFQRHAFLYHEGKQRKVFPCPVCQKEFSRPDKMKQHLKQAHDCIIPKPDAPPPPPSSFVINPFLHLDDPASMAGKMETLKETGNRLLHQMRPISGGEAR